MMTSVFNHQELVMRSLVLNVSLVALALWSLISVACQL